ncbi:MAG: hypothetical protein NC485_00040 [Ruminococcus flavefaciens]|nr:hypothetical protein [Ruminococcus flavefaciens]
MENQDNFFERLAHERNITVEQMKQIISNRIKQGLNDLDPEKRKSWEAIPRKGNIPTPEEWLKYAVEKLEMSGQGDSLRWFVGK